MGKATIIEAQNSNTVYEEGKSKGTLGKLKGIFADYRHGTRNSDRLYTEELWDNRVFGSPDVMEALQTKTLFGELDHPEGDRCETLAKNAAITITKLEKKPDEGVIYGEAEILDTPTGRIVKALADSGAQLGISSRGMGEEVYREGKNIIDPDTYDFITFDVVVTPANTKARVSLTESKHLNKLTESLQKEIKESETSNQLSQIKTVLENTNIENKNVLLKQVENKIKTLNKPVNDKLTEANRTLALNLLKKKFTEQTNTLQQTIQTSEQIAKENETLIEEKTKLENSNKQLIEEKQFLDESRTTMKTKLKEAKVQIDTLNKNIKDMETSDKNAISQNTIVLQKQLQLAINKAKKLESDNKQLQENNKKLNENNDTLHTQLTNLHKINEKMSKNLEANSKIILEGKKQINTLQNKIKTLEEQKVIVQDKNNKLTTKLTENKKLEEQNTVQLQNRVKELEEELNRFSKLSFNPVGASSIIAENFKETQYTQEELDLINAIANK